MNPIGIIVIVAALLLVGLGAIWVGRRQLRRKKRERRQQAIVLAPPIREDDR